MEFEERSWSIRELSQKGQDKPDMYFKKNHRYVLFPALVRTEPENAISSFNNKE